MPTMKSARTAAPGTIKVAEIQRPAAGPRDLLVRVRACGICGTDAAFVQMGGMPPGPEGETAAIPLGHEPAGEVVEIGAEVTGLKTGDRVVVNPQAAPSGIIGCGGTLGGVSEYLLIQNAVAGKSVERWALPLSGHLAHAGPHADAGATRSARLPATQLCCVQPVRLTPDRPAATSALRGGGCAARDEHGLAGPAGTAQTG